MGESVVFKYVVARGHCMKNAALRCRGRHLTAKSTKESTQRRARQVFFSAVRRCGYLLRKRWGIYRGAERGLPPPSTGRS